MARLGWIGLGRIGLPMASRLLSGGHELRVYDLEPAKVREMVSRGAEAAASPSEMGVWAETVFTCVVDGRAVEDVLFGSQGLTTTATAETLVVDHTSIDPLDCRALAARAQAECGLRVVDAPVSGGPTAAGDGKLIAWLGGDAEDVNRVRPLIACYVTKATHMGAIGHGQVGKSCNQFIVASTVALWSQMLRYAESRGVNPSTLIQTLEGGAAESPISRVFARQIVDDTIPPESIRNMTKDMRIILHLRGETGQSWPLAETALAEFETYLGGSCD